MPKPSLASLTSKTDTETVIRDLVSTGEIDERNLTILPDHFDTRTSCGSYHYCALCGTTLKPGDRLENHLSAKKGHSLDPKGKVALALISFSKGVMEKIKGASLNLDLIPDPETEAEQRIHRAYMKQMAAMGVPIVGKPKPTVADAASLTKTLQSLVKTLKNEDTEDDIRPRQAARDRSPSPLHGHIGQDEPPEPILYDDGPMDTHNPNNDVPRQFVIESINDNIFTGGTDVSAVFMKQPRTDLMFHHEVDHLDPLAYVVAFLPKGKHPGWVLNASTKLELWRKLSPERHSLLKEYTLFVGSIQSKDGKASTSSVGVGAYPSYCARFALVAMRARQRYGETLSVDDILFSCAYLNAFFNRLKSENVSISVRLNFMKSIRHLIKWLEQFIINPVWLTGVRFNMCEAVKTRLRYVLNELKVEDKKELAIQNVAREAVKKPVLYCVARALVYNKAITDELKRIVNKVRNDHKDATHAEYNFVLGALFLAITVFNTSRNEACYKSINASFIESKSLSGAHIQGTGFLKIVEGTRNYYIATYPNPKQARGMRTRTSVLGGLIVLDDRLSWIFTAYRLLKDKRLARLTTKPPTGPRDPYFLKYDGTPVDMYTTPWLMKTVLRIMNITEDISCNTVRHTTANMQFDDYVRRELSGGAHRDIAYTTGHQTDTQLRRYTDDHKKIGLAGFKKLEQLADEEWDRNLDTVKAALMTVKLTKKLKKFDDIIAEQEDELDEHSQLFRDVEESDEEEDGDIERMAADTEEQPMHWDRDRIHGPRAKRRDQHGRGEEYDSQDDMRDASSILSLDSSSSDEQRSRKKPSGAGESRSARTSENNEQQVFEDSTYVGLMRELQLSDKSGIVDKSDVILAAIKEHNAAKPGQPKLTMKEEDLVDFKRRRYNRPVQNFSWVAVRRRRDGQNGLFAKSDIPKGSVVVDYRGRTLSASDHANQLKTVTPVESDKIAAYYFEHKFEMGRERLVVGIEAHHAVYDGTVVLGRFLNHSLCCSNLVPRFHKEIRGDKLEIYIYFTSTRNIKANEELLWNYGIYFGDMPWYHMCECKSGAASRDHTPWELSAESKAELARRGPSMSQSAVDAPLVLLPQQNPHRTLIQLTYASTAYRKLYLADMHSDCSTALRQAHTVFTNNEVVVHSAALDRQSDVHRMLSVMVDHLKHGKSAVLVLKGGDWSPSSVAIAIGQFELGMLIICGESPTQFQTLTATPARRADQTIDRLFESIPLVRPSVQALQQLLRNPDISSRTLIQYFK